MELTGDLITNLKLVDISTVNGKFTWNNRRGVANKVASRLDKFLALEDLVSVDVFYEASILPTFGSDHWLIRMEIDMKECKKNWPFRFESFWLRDPTFVEKTKGWWETNHIQGRNRMHSFQLMLKNLKQEIKKWNKIEFGNIHQDKESLQGEMKRVQQLMINHGRTEALVVKEGNILSQLEE